MFNYTNHGYIVNSVEFIYGEFDEKYSVTFYVNRNTKKLEIIDAETDDAQYFLREILGCELVHQDGSSFEPNEAINTLYLRFKEEFENSTGLE
jgi:hypothetical protein